MERRAGPACPAAGTSHRYPVYRWVPLRRAGACPRRCAALPITTGVGAGIPDGPGWGAVWARQGCRALRWGVQKGRRPPPRDGVGTAALRLRRGDCAICGWRFGTMGDFAPCAARVFRPLRRAGISLAAASDQRLCLWKPRFFEKNRVKLLMFGAVRDGGAYFLREYGVFSKGREVRNWPSSR